MDIRVVLHGKIREIYTVNLAGQVDVGWRKTLPTAARWRSGPIASPSARAASHVSSPGRQG
jgi:hypothetical protein